MEYWALSESLRDRVEEIVGAGFGPPLTVWQDDLTKTTNCVAHAAPQRLGHAATRFRRATSKDKTCQQPFNALEPRPTRLAP